MKGKLNARQERRAVARNAKPRQERHSKARHVAQAQTRAKTIILDAQDHEKLLRASLELNQLRKELKETKEKAMTYHLAALKIESDLKAERDEARKLHLEATLRNADLTLRLQQVMASGVCEVGGRRWVEASKIAEVLQ